MRVLSHLESDRVVGAGEVEVELSAGINRGPITGSATIRGSMSIDELSRVNRMFGGGGPGPLDGLMQPGLEVLSRNNGVVGFRDRNTAAGAIVLPK